MTSKRGKNITVTITEQAHSNIHGIYLFYIIKEQKNVNDVFYESVLLQIIRKNQSNPRII